VPLLVRGVIALLRQGLGQTPRQLLPPLPHSAGQLLQGRFRLLHLRLQGVEPRVKPFVHLLAALRSLLLLSDLCQRNHCGGSHGGLLSMLGRAPHRAGSAAHRVKSLA
jgi:hypothetical protein